MATFGVRHSALLELMFGFHWIVVVIYICREHRRPGIVRDPGAERHRGRHREGRARLPERPL